MDNTRAGLAAVETGALRSRDILTDVYLAGVWVDALQRTAWLARRLGKDGIARQTAEAHAVARESLERRFAGAAAPIPFAIMRDGTLQGASTVWPAFGIWRGQFTATRPAAQRTLDALAGPDVAADWGARMLGRESALYDPLSYNNGAVWPFVSGFAALALYAGGRPDAAFQYTDALGQLAFVESRGYTAELFSGDRLRSVDAAVPHQLFASSGFVSALLRGLAGFDAPGDGDGPMRVRPWLPAGWDRLEVRNLRWRGHRVSMRLDREADSARIRVDITPGPIDLIVEWPLPPGASPGAVSMSGSFRGRHAVQETLKRPGVSFAVRRPPLAAGETSDRLRVLDVRLDGERVVARVAGRRGREYLVDVHGARRETVAATGARLTIRSGPGSGTTTIALRVDDGAEPWGEAQVTALPR
jgi:hypothetical protein